MDDDHMDVGGDGDRPLDATGGPETSTTTPTTTTIIHVRHARDQPPALSVTLTPVHHAAGTVYQGQYESNTISDLQSLADLFACIGFAMIKRSLPAFDATKFVHTVPGGAATAVAEMPLDVRQSIADFLAQHQGAAEITIQPPDRRLAGSGNTEVKSMAAFKNAWTCAYRDERNNVADLYDYIMDCKERWDPDTYFSPYITLVKPSGYGKSRFIIELAKTRAFCIYICMRGPKSTGYPFRSHCAGYFDDMKGKDDLSAFMDCTAFTIGTLEYLIHRKTENPDLSPREWVEEQLKETKKTSGERVSGQAFWEAAEPFIARARNHMFSGIDTKKMDPEAVKTATENAVRANYESAARRLGIQEPICLLMDEARELLKSGKESAHNADPFRVIRRGLNKQPRGSCLLFGIFVDTQSRVGDFSLVVRFVFFSSFNRSMVCLLDLRCLLVRTLMRRCEMCTMESSYSIRTGC